MQVVAGRSRSGLQHQRLQHGFLGMQAVLRLVYDEGALGIEDLARDLLSTVDGTTVENPDI